MSDDQNLSTMARAYYDHEARIKRIEGAIERLDKDPTFEPTATAGFHIAQCDVYAETVLSRAEARAQLDIVLAQATEARDALVRSMADTVNAMLPAPAPKGKGK